MDSFVRSIKKRYVERRITCEIQWPHRHDNKLIKLQLVETKTGSAISRREIYKDGGTNRAIKCEDLFSPSSKTPIVRKVLVEGDAGMGKTTLCTSASIDWANDAVFQQFELVLLLPLRDKGVALAGTISELLKLLHGSQVIRTAVASRLEEMEGENVLIIADGWDELSKDDRNEGSFLYNLLFGGLLPFVSVLLTSRPSATASLRYKPYIDRLVKVVGFNRENIKDYVECELADDKSKCCQLLQQLDSNPLIESICGVPLNCAIVCELSYSHETLPHTMTELYANIILHTIFRNITKLPEYSSIMSISSFQFLPGCLKNKFWSLCKFAFESIAKNQIVFTQEQINAMIQPSVVSFDELLIFGLVQCVHTILSDEVGYGHSLHFIHLTIQEFLAAYHLSRQSPDKQLEVVKSQAGSAHFRMVWRFFFGISYTQSLHDVKVELSQKVISMFMNKLCYFDKLLLFHCSLESGTTNNFTSLVAQSQLLTRNRKLGFLIQSYIARNVFDCIAILHVIENTISCDEIVINFSGCKLGDKEIDLLVHALHSKLQVEVLYLGGNNLSNKSIQDLFRKTASFESLEDLRLSQNPLGVSGIKELEASVRTKTLSNLRILSLAKCFGNDADENNICLVSFLDALSTHCNHLRELDLSKNNFGVIGAQSLGKALPQLMKYKFNSSYDRFGHENQRDRMRYDTKRSELNLSETMLGDEGVCTFLQNIEAKCYISRLDISGNDVHDVGVSSLADSICSGKLILENLCLNDNPLRLDAVVAIGRMLSTGNSKLSELYLSNCQLTVSDSLSSTNMVSKLEVAHSASNYEIQCHSAVTTRSIRERLYQMSQNCNNTLCCITIDRNDFSGENGIVLAGLMYICQNTRTLSSKKCNITLCSFESLFDQFHGTLPNLYSWDLADNSISDEAVQVLFHHLPQFPRLSMDKIYFGQNVEKPYTEKDVCIKEKTLRSTGLRVVRGRDWQSGNIDGGKGHVGTVVEIGDRCNGGRRVAVQWDCGNRCSYHCCGVDGKYDLRVLYNPDCCYSVVCDSCNMQQLIGCRWTCVQCEKCDLCTSCYMSDKGVTKGCLKHEFDCYWRPNDCVRVPPRCGARRVEVKGLYPGAEVRKGHDWDPGDEHIYCSEPGTVTSLLHSDTSVNAVGIRCVRAVSGGYHYLDHLPMLGATKSEHFDMMRVTRHVNSDRETSEDEQQDKISTESDQLSTIGRSKHMPSLMETESCCTSGPPSEAHTELQHSDKICLQVDDLKTVRTAIWKARLKWYDLGVELDVSVSSLEAIKADNFYQSIPCFTSMLRHWLQKGDPKPTWTRLVEALKSLPVDHVLLAKEIEKKYCM